MKLYSSAWELACGPSVILRDALPAPDFHQDLGQLREQGYRPLCVAATGSLTEVPLHGAIWERSAGPGWQVGHGIGEAELPAHVEQHVAAGYRLKQLVGHASPRGVQFLTLWERSSGSDWSLLHGLDAAGLQRSLDEHGARGHCPTGLTVYPSPQGLRYAVIWDSQGDQAWSLHHNADAASFRSTSAAHADWRLLTAAACVDGTREVWCGLWHRADPRTRLENRHGLGLEDHRALCDSLIASGYRPGFIGMATAPGRQPLRRFAVLCVHPDQQAALEPLRQALDARGTACSLATTPEAAWRSIERDCDAARPGERVLVVLAGHGSSARRSPADLDPALALEHRIGLQHGDLVLRELLPIFEQAALRGVPLTVIDAGAHAGESVLATLGAPYTVIATQDVLSPGQLELPDLAALFGPAPLPALATTTATAPLAAPPAAPLDPAAAAPRPAGGPARDPPAPGGGEAEFASYWWGAGHAGLSRLDGRLRWQRPDRLVRRAFRNDPLEINRQSLGWRSALASFAAGGAWEMQAWHCRLWPWAYPDVDVTAGAAARPGSERPAADGDARRSPDRRDATRPGAARAARAARSAPNPPPAPQPDARSAGSSPASAPTGPTPRPEAAGVDAGDYIAMLDAAVFTPRRPLLEPLEARLRDRRLAARAAAVFDRHRARVWATLGHPAVPPPAAVAEDAGSAAETPEAAAWRQRMQVDPADYADADGLLRMTDDLLATLDELKRLEGLMCQALRALDRRLPASPRRAPGQPTPVPELHRWLAGGADLQRLRAAEDAELALWQELQAPEPGRESERTPAGPDGQPGRGRQRAAPRDRLRDRLRHAGLPEALLDAACELRWIGVQKTGQLIRANVLLGVLEAAWIAAEAPAAGLAADRVRC